MISNWYYYFRPDIPIKSIKLGVRYFLNFHIDQLITIWQVHIIILGIIIKQNVVIGIGKICVLERLPVITNPRFKRLNKCLHPILHLNKGKIGFRNGNNRWPCNIISILKYHIRTKGSLELMSRYNPTEKALWSCIFVKVSAPLKPLEQHIFQYICSIMYHCFIYCPPL